MQHSTKTKRGVQLLSRHKGLFTEHSQISCGIVSILRGGIITLLLNFVGDDQKRHSAESGIAAEWHNIEI